MAKTSMILTLRGLERKAESHTMRYMQDSKEKETKADPDYAE